MRRDGHGRVRRPVKSDIRRATRGVGATPSSVIASFSTGGVNSPTSVAAAPPVGSGNFEQLADQADFDLWQWAIHYRGPTLIS